MKRRNTGCPMIKFTFLIFQFLSPLIGTCTYNKFCWFIHDQYEYDKKIKIKNNEVVDKIGMMEKKMVKMTEKLTQIENNDL